MNILLINSVSMGHITWTFNYHAANNNNKKKSLLSTNFNVYIIS